MSKKVRKETNRAMRQKLAELRRRRAQGRRQIDAKELMQLLGMTR